MTAAAAGAPSVGPAPEEPAVPVGAWGTPTTAIDDWLGEQYARVQGMQSVEDVGLFVGTWNVNGKLPAEDITPWLRGKQGQAHNGGGGGSASIAHDDLDHFLDDHVVGGGQAQTQAQALFPRVWVFCLQEMVDLDAGNIVDEGPSQRRLLEWEHMLLAAVRSHAAAQPDESTRAWRFSVLGSKSMVGVALVIIVEDSLSKQVRYGRVETQSVGTGAMDMGNKGGIGMRLELRDTSLCFISSHLAAHREKVQSRNDDFATIERKLLFEHTRTPDSDLDKPGGVCLEAISYTSPIAAHDCVVWAGDLNYRIHVDLPVGMVLDNAKSGNLAPLLAKDQLLTEMLHGRVFQGYTEGAIKFPPTYKYEAGTRHYDERARPDPNDPSGKKKKGKLRAPAWCDRILWRCAETSPLDQSPQDYRPLEQLEYFSVHLLGSDHMPVGTFFRLRLRTFDRQQRLQISKELHEQVQREYVAPLSRMRVEPDIVAFPKLSYHSSSSEQVTLVNRGSVAQRFCVLPSSYAVHPTERGNHYADWLSVRPAEGVVQPGQAVQLKLHARANVRLAARLMRGKQNVGATIVLRTATGPDLHVYVSGFYRQSAFGVDLEELLYHAGPVAKAVIGPQDGQVTHAPKPTTVPKELWMLADPLMRVAGRVPGLFAWAAGPSFSTTALLNPGVCGPGKKVDAAHLYAGDTQLETGQAAVRRAVDNYTALGDALAANPAALSRSLLCLLASIWQHRRVPEDLLGRLEQDRNSDSVLRTYLWHIGPAYKATFMYLASFAAFLTASGGQAKAEVVPALSAAFSALHSARLRPVLTRALVAAVKFVTVQASTV